MGKSERCNNCKYSKLAKGYFQCRRHVPTVQAVLVTPDNYSPGREWQTKTMWPRMASDDWCGEWTAATEDDTPAKEE